MSYTYGTEEWENAYREMVNDRLKKAEKPYIMGTPEWVATFEKLIQEDEQYKEVAKTWEGTVVIHILANPSIGLNSDIFMLMDLWHGDCRSVRLVPKEVGENADFVLTGEFERWQAVMKKELDVVKAMMQGKIKLKGALPTIVRYVKASIRLVDLSAQIETRFHPDMSDAEKNEYLSWFNDLRSKFDF
ncbi:MAG: SCP2 sterol-binding domain-containing protein [Bacillota bacterium]|nr:SCP2 sterol-binding domain-containing protein [Bacillota bacterium]